MKSIYKILGSLALAATVATSCSDDISSVVESISLDRPLSPTTLKVGVPAGSIDGTTVVFTWDAMADASSYIFQVAKDSAFTAIEDEQEVEESTATVLFANADQNYSARVLSIGLDGTKSLFTQNDSVWITKFYEELKSVEAVDRQVDCVTIVWTDDADVTSIVISKVDSKEDAVKLTVTAEEAQSMSKIIPELAENTKYHAVLYCNKSVRGQLDFSTRSTKEENVTTAEEFFSALDFLAADGVIIVCNDIDLGDENANFTKAVTITANDTCTTVPTLTVSKQWRVGSESVAEADLAANAISKIQITGLNFELKGNYLFNVDATYNFELKSLEIVNSTFTFTKNNGRSLFRTQGSTAQHLSNVLIDNCIVNNCAQEGQSYSLLHFSATTKTTADGTPALPAKIDIKNSTFNTLSSLLFFAKVTATSGETPSVVNIDNCTFNNLGLDDNKARYFIDLTCNKSLAPEVININSSVFGKTLLPASPNTGTFCPIRTMSSGTVKVAGAGNYATTDFLFSETPEKAFVEVVPGVTTLAGDAAKEFVDAENGNLKLTDASAANAGDPRWK